MSALHCSTPRPRVARATPAERAMAAAAAMVDPIGLDELIALAELQTRVDRKYFVPAEVFRRMIAELAGELRVLDIDGRRTSATSRSTSTPRPGHLPGAPAAPPAAVQGPHPDLHRQRADHVRGQAHRSARRDRQAARAAPGRAPRRAHRRGPGPPAQHAVPGLPPGPAGRDAADAGHHLPAHHVRLPHRRGAADLRRRVVCRDPSTRSTTPAPTCWWRASPAGRRQRRRPDAARPGRAPGLGEQVLRRRRRTAPRTALQPLAPDPAALLRAAPAAA